MLVSSSKSRSSGVSDGLIVSPSKENLSLATGCPQNVLYSAIILSKGSVCNYEEENNLVRVFKDKNVLHWDPDLREVHWNNDISTFWSPMEL